MLSKELKKKIGFLLETKTRKAPNGCLEWMKGKDGAGYGLQNIKELSKNHHPVRAHVLSWIYHYGYWPKRPKCVCHKCDNPSCCNPDHLFVGTHKDNMADCKNKGRNVFLFGENSPLAILTDDKVRQIRHLHSEGLGYRKLSKMFNYDRAGIRKIVKLKIWKHTK